MVYTMNYDTDLDEYVDALDLGIEEMTEEELEDYRYRTESQMSLYGINWGDFL